MLFKRIHLFLVSLLACLSVDAQDMPVFSTEGSETWYLIQFKNKNKALADQGLNATIRTAVPKPCKEQLWKLVGNADNFQLINQLGHYIVVSNAPDYTTNPTNTTPVQSSTQPFQRGFKLIATQNYEFAPAWEIQPNTTPGKCFNQWGGAGTGQSIGIWDANDPNNPLVFIDPNEMVADDFKVIGTTDYKPQNNLTLWYRIPATLTNSDNNWMEYSLPIGNGQFGASIFGGVFKDEIQFNEKTLWSGRSTDNGKRYGSYQNFGSVIAENLDKESFGNTDDKAATDYVRGLDLSNATAFVNFKNAARTATYERQYIASFPDKVVAAHYTCTGEGKISLRFTLNSGKPGIYATTSYSNGEATFSGQLETISYNTRLKVVQKGGEISTSDAGIEVRNADEVTLILAGGTDYDAYSPSYTSHTSELATTIRDRVNSAAGKSWETLYSSHLEDFKGYFDRCNFQLEGADNNLATDELINQYAQRYSGTEDYALMLEQLYFAYGRYLEIASSRGVDLPSNLQGIWNNCSSPDWNSDIHSNINVQMNYWPAEPTNLSDMHLPFLNYIINMAVNHDEWKGYAADAGQEEGWTCYTENNIFGGVGSFAHNYVIANAWYCTHLWQHYRYTLNRDFLKRAFPAMWSASRFWILRLVKAADGTYECPDEYSPEHGPKSENGVAHAQQLVYDLLQNTQMAAEILGADADVPQDQLDILADRLANLDKGLDTEIYDGGWGSMNGVKSGDELLCEWKYSKYYRGENRHRHMSHLMCIYPFHQVTPSSPYFQAAVNSMKLRGDASTGWSMGWKINLWARIQDGDHAHDILELALRHHNVAGGGVYYNLFDSHEPFQIDGNFGACAGIAEMLMQSQTNTIEILPALPSVWKSGNIKGMKAIGDFTVDIEWKDLEATLVTITSNQGQPLTVSHPNIAGKKICVNNQEVRVEMQGEHTVIIPAEKDDVVTIHFDQLASSIEAATAQSVAIRTNGRTVTVSGLEVASIAVSDMAGRTLQHSSEYTFDVCEEIGNVMIILTITDAQGNTSAHKVSLK